MKKTVFVILVTALLVGSVFFAGRVSQASAREPKILEFDSMAGLPSGLVASANKPIRGVNGGGLPWSIGPSYGELKADGKLEIQVNDLVFAAGPNVGKNTVPAFRAIVSCLNEDGSATNIMTDPFPATTFTATDPGGDATIEARLSLPQPCIAPIIFITNPNGAWFAVTGR